MNFKIILLVLSLSLIVYSCQDDIFEEQLNSVEHTKDYNLENRSQDSIFLLVSYSSSQGYNLEFSNDDAETLFKHMADAFGIDSSLVTYSDIEVDDVPDSTNAAPFIVLSGENPTGGSLSFGIDVIKSINSNGGLDYEYDATQDNEGQELFKKHKCEAGTCDACKVIRGGLLNSRFKACDCQSSTPGAACNYSVKTMSLFEVIDSLLPSS